MIGTCVAAPTLEWEIELTNYVDTVGWSGKMKQYADGSVAVVVDNSLLVFNADSSLKISDYTRPLGFFATEFTDHASTPDFISIFYYNQFGEYTRNYSITGTNYTVENLTVNGYTPGSTGGVDPSIWYVIIGTKLHKYNLGSAPTIQGTVASGISGSNYILNWPSSVGISYQIQNSTNLTDWVDVGFPISGTGSPLTWANALTNSQSFYRVIEN
jgi:hypothetical protein